MDANVKISRTRNRTHKGRTYKGTVRMAASALVLVTLLSGCSSVPDAVNPVKWYQKTTDFFSGDRQAAALQPDPAKGQKVATNNGLAADPNAPPPAVASQDVANASKGLNADQPSTEYASPALARQGAPRNVLTAKDTVALKTPPLPKAQPTAPVMPAAMALAPVASVKPSTSVSGPAPMMTPPAMTPPKRLSFADAPSPPKFNMPSNNANVAGSPFSRDQFETVVITADGMETVSTARPKFKIATNARSQVQAARFPDPGISQQGPVVTPVNVGGMTRVATIHFANNSSSMDQRDKSILDAVVQLQHERGGRVVVIGHASSRTRDMDFIRHQMVNFEISMKRASAIGNALKVRGLTDGQLDIQAVSDAQPLYQEVMPSGEVGNRRVEIYLDPRV